eukprot:gene8672-10184_t
MFGRLVDISDSEDEYEDQNIQEKDLLSKDAVAQQSLNGSFSQMTTIGGGGAQDTLLRMIDEHSRKKTIDVKNITEKQSDLDKKISHLLSIIERPWSFVELDGPICSIEGELLKKKRFDSGWKRYYFALNGNNLYYYKSKNSKKPKGIISVSFVSPPLVLTEKNIVDMKTPEVSNYLLHVYSHKRIDSLCATNNEDFERWNNVLQRLVKNTLEYDDYNDRFEAFQEVYPLFEKKTELELDRLLLLLAEIDNKSTHIIGKAKKEKTGNLLMMEDDENTGEITWRQYYFALLNQCLYFYKSSKLPPQGLSTPLSVFILKAKHQVAMEDWIDSLVSSKQGRPKTTIGVSVNAQPPLPMPLNVAPEVFTNKQTYVFGKKVYPTLSFVPHSAAPGTKTKVSKMSLGSNTIGRSESCNIVVDDKKVSRTHCKIEVTESTCVLLDMGSGHGTKVNRKVIDRHVLEVGDKIKIGKTTLLFDIVKK